MALSDHGDLEARARVGLLVCDGDGVPWTPSVCVHRGRPSFDVLEQKAGFGSPRLHAGRELDRRLLRNPSVLDKTARVSMMFQPEEVIEALLEERGGAVRRCIACGRWNYHLRGCPLFGRSR